MRRALAAVAVVGGVVALAVFGSGGDSKKQLCVHQPLDGGWCRRQIADGRSIPIDNLWIPADAGVDQCSAPEPCHEVP